MKIFTIAALASLVLLGGCSSWSSFQFDNDEDCHDMVDARERLNCFEQADREVSERRAEQRKEDDK